jgi:hypothetical protein
MRKRFVVSKPRLYSYDEDPVHLAGTTVHEDEPQVVETGLLDAQGKPITRIEGQIGPIGFVHHSED